MEQTDKKVIFLDISQIKDIKDDYDIAEFNDSNSVFKIIHRCRGMSEDFLQTTLHWHNYYELEVVYGGNGIHILSKSSCNMSRGYACLRSPNHLHTTLEDHDNPLKLFNIKFSADYIPNDISTYLVTSDNSVYVNFNDEELELILTRIRQLFSELKTQDQHTHIMVKAIFTDIFITFIRKYHLKENHISHNSTHIQSVISYIQNNFRDDINLKSLAEKVYLTPNYLGELFIKETGKTCSNYIQDLRFTLAIQLLINTSLSIKEITSECGFHSTSYFIRKFREKYHVSPSRYRLMRNS
ncbi:MAG: AraC family transcriptional regulator [Eubacteriales bacterium]